MNESKTVFDDIFLLLSPDRLLCDPRATGEGVRLGLIDSGVERSVIETKYKDLGQELLPIEGGVFRAAPHKPPPRSGRQSSPHGTTVADIILTLAPRVKLFSADVFGPAGACEVETVIRA